ncbi:MAG: histidinol dehydrogenase, partial [Synergistaceae bacterium]|nr:histidinol dehydrogenase [Synergistaceae bacterium]
MIRTITASDFMKLRQELKSVDVSATVKSIIENVKVNGDNAVKHYEKEFDNVTLSSLEVTEREKRDSLKKVSPDFVEILERAAKNIREFHSQQVRNDLIFSNSE